MKKIADKNYSLLLSFLVLLSGLVFLFFYLSAAREKYSLAIAQSENKVMLTVIFVTGMLGLILNLVSVYKTFCDTVKIPAGIKLLLLNFPLMLVQAILVYGWFILNGIF